MKPHDAEYEVNRVREFKGSLSAILERNVVAPSIGGFRRITFEFGENIGEDEQDDVMKRTFFSLHSFIMTSQSSLCTLPLKVKNRLNWNTLCFFFSFVCYDNYVPLTI